MKKEGFKEIQLDDKNSNLKYTTTYSNNKKGYGYITNSAYKNKKTKFVAEKQSMYKNKDGKLIANKNYIDNDTQANNQD